MINWLLPLLRNWRVIAPILIVLVLVAVYAWRGWALHNARTELAASAITTAQQQTAINDYAQATATLEAKSKQQARRVKRAQVLATHVEAETQAAAQATLTETVPAHCDQALRWAITKARALNAGWRWAQ